MKRAMICTFLAVAACDFAAPGGGAPNAADSQPAAAREGEARKAAFQPAVLEGEGLSLPPPDGGPAEAIGFGAARETAVAALSRAFGRKPTRTGSNEQCGGGGLEFAEWENSLVAWFQEGKFAGWDSRGRLETANGVGIGSTRGEAARLEGFKVEESTLGIEFSAGSLGGIFESDRPDAKLTALWAGTTCMFR